MHIYSLVAGDKSWRFEARNDRAAIYGAVARLHGLGRCVFQACLWRESAPDLLAEILYSPATSRLEINGQVVDLNNLAEWYPA